MYANYLVYELVEHLSFLELILNKKIFLIIINLTNKNNTTIKLKIKFNKKFKIKKYRV